MANLRITAASRNAALSAIKAAVDAGAGPGTLKVYAGAQPANADAALAGNTLLGTLALAYPCAPDAVGGVLTFSAITEDSAADASGAATFARIADSNGNTVFDCDVTATGGGGTIELNTVNIAAGGPIRVLAFALSIPA